MTKSNCFRDFLKYSSLNVMGMIGLSCYILADTFFVSKGLGTNGLTSLNLAIPIYSFIHGTGLMIGMGGGTRYSILKGQNHHESANHTFTNAIYLAAMFAVFFVLAGIFFSDDIISLFGAAFATGLAPVFSILILLPYFIRKKNMFHFVKCKAQKAPFTKILSSGIPSLITEVSSGVVMIVFNAIILNLSGNVGVAAYGVIANLSLVIISIYTGIAQGIQPIISRSYGMKKLRDIHATLRYAFTTMLLFSVIIYGVIFLGASQITDIFNSEQNAMLQKIATEGLRLYFLACPFAGFNIIISMYFTSTEWPRPAHVISLLRGFLVIIPMAFLLSWVGEIRGVWCAFPATELLVAVIGLCFFLRKNNKQDEIVL